jgi:pimeloyl-ACP methyl ester carboxylesterase
VTETVVPFRLFVAEAELDDLRLRLRMTRFPEDATTGDWRQGPPVAAMQALCAYWASDYDWRRCETELNGLGQFRTLIDGLDIHFLHIRSAEAGALPLLLCHGWPGSIIEFRKAIGPLVDPVRYGGRASDAFHLVIPSMPGFGFSAKPAQPGWDIARIARAWAVLMARLGYDRWVAQGGDLGSAVVETIARHRAEGCIGIHLNMAFFLPTPDEVAEADADEQVFIGQRTHYFRDMAGYAAVQGTRPQTIGYSLADSPAGQAAWIYEKFHEAVDHDGDLGAVIDRDDLLDMIMMYWLPNAGAAAARLYWELQQGGPPPAGLPPIELPTGYSCFPGEIIRNSRRWLESRFSRLVHYGQPARGGHFAAFEQPDLFVTELRRTFFPVPLDEGANVDTH